MARILVVDDEAKLGKLVGEALELDGHVVTRAGSGRAALVELNQQRYDLVLTDLRMTEMDGLAVLRAAKALKSPPEVLIMTAYSSTESAVAAMREGASDYLIKPFAMEELRLRVGRLADQRLAMVRNEKLVERLTPALVAESASMKNVLAAARRVAKSDTTVLLLGESGTGKSQLARFIHYESHRAGGPLQEVQCAALPETLLESEFFGHERGSFTGAAQRRVGHLASADQGTLFLDEIGEVPLSMQVKLLRFLQEHELIPVGANETIRVDVRVISATNKDLAAAVRAGAFREDFFYRLNVFGLEVPPLRERKDDILPLAERILGQDSRLTSAAQEALLRHTWPGNIRELENTLARAVIFAGSDDIRPEHLRAPSTVASTPVSKTALDVLQEGFNLDDFERSLIHAALDRTQGNKTAAAKLLGITRRRLYSRLQSLGE